MSNGFGDNKLSSQLIEAVLPTYVLNILENPLRGTPK